MSNDDVDEYRELNGLKGIKTDRAKARRHIEKDRVQLWWDEMKDETVDDQVPTGVETSIDPQLMEGMTHIFQCPSQPFQSN